MKVALCQLNSRQDKELNIISALSQLDHAGQEGARLAVLPECIDYMGKTEGIKSRAEIEFGPTIRRFSEKSREYNMWILAGSIRTLNTGDPRCSNTSYLINPQGEVVHSYDKIHMFDVVVDGQINFKESDAIKPGEEIGFAVIDDIPVGISICYDIRFPELFRIQSKLGAKILFVPAAFTLFTGKDHWETLLRARAIENQCYVVAVGQWGNHGEGLTSYGRSMVIDPWGTVLGCLPDGVNTSVFKLDMKKVDEVRKMVPSLANSKPEFYKKF